MAQKLRTLMFVGSVRNGRNADRVIAFMKNVLSKSQDIDLKIFDPKVMKLPLLEQPIHFYPDQSKAPKALQEAHEEVKKADAFIFLSAEYNRSLTPALANLIDHFSPSAYAWKPVLPVTYSMSPQAGLVSGMTMLPMCRELGLSLTPCTLSIPTVHQALSEDGKVQRGFEFISSTVELSTSQLIWLGNVLKKARESKQPPPKSQPYL